MATITELRELFENFLNERTLDCQLKLETAIAQYAIKHPPAVCIPSTYNREKITVQPQSIPELQRIVKEITCHKHNTLLTVLVDGTVVVNVQELTKADVQAVLACDNSPPRLLWEFINKRASADWPIKDHVFLTLSDLVLE